MSTQQNPPGTPKEEAGNRALQKIIPNIPNMKTTNLNKAKELNGLQFNLFKQNLNQTIVTTKSPKLQQSGKEQHRLENEEDLLYPSIDKNLFPLFDGMGLTLLLNVMPYLPCPSKLKSIMVAIIATFDKQKLCPYFYKEHTLLKGSRALPGVSLRRMIDKEQSKILDPNKGIVVSVLALQARQAIIMLLNPTADDTLLNTI